MKIIFAGTPPFAAAALEALIAAGHEVSLVLSQPDRPSGRGMKLTASPVKTLALAHDIPVATPLTLSLARGGEEAAAAQQLIASQNADLMVVAAYGLILPQTVLDMPKGIGRDGSIKAMNIHASLLPRWRGAAPITRAIEVGDAETGVTLMKMEAGLDTGPMIETVRTPISAEDTTDSLTERLAAMGAQLMVEALKHPDDLGYTPQDEAAATYAKKILKSEAHIDWCADAEQICRRLRAFTPFPGCSTTIRGTVIKLWKCEPAEAPEGTQPGTITSLEGGVTIAAGRGAVRFTVLQKPGKARMDWKPFLQSFPLETGMRCDE